MIYTDIAEYTKVTSRDSMTDLEVLGTPTETKARIEIEDITKKDKDGNLVVYKRLYILPKNVVLTKGDYIRAIKIGGSTITETVMKVELVFPVSRYSLHHYEVYCK